MFGLKEKKTALSKKQIDSEANGYEETIGVDHCEEAVKRTAYLANFKSTTDVDHNGVECAALLLYFMEETGSWTKAVYPYQPYFFLLCADEVIKEIMFYLNNQYEKLIEKIDAVSKEDLELVNHLSGKTQRYLKLSFKNVTDLMTVRQELLPLIQKNQREREEQDAYEDWYNADITKKSGVQTHLSKILDIREYDVPYHIRVCIDKEIRIGKWYEFDLDGPMLKDFRVLPNKLDKADLRVFAFDIETAKQPLKFPDARYDQIMMISYIVDGCGFLITNRQIVGDDVQNFEYAPRADYDVGMFTVFNEPDEAQLLKKFFDHIRETKPFIFVTFNGDGFDWPYIQARAETHHIKMEEEIGIYNSSQDGFTGRFASHMDCFYWVKRDAYLPAGSHGLKMVTKAKLGYDPVELDPELMVPYAQERPQDLAEYSVSDSVATYFLYMKMIHDFIFALCTIIPTYPDEVLRRGSGTLCEDLLMAKAWHGNIIFPNKQVDKAEKYHKGKLVESETYIGGHVECLQTGVYRSDIPVKFKLMKEGYQDLLEKVEEIMDFALDKEMGGIKKEDVENYDEIKTQIEQQLINIMNKCPVLDAEPLIYHVDVAAMYPNIILTNRLQPVAIVNEQICAGCQFNRPENNCKRPLDWQWRGELYPLSKGEYEARKVEVKLEMENEIAQQKTKKSSIYTERDNYMKEREKLKARVKQYCRTAYKQTHITKVEQRTDTVCMRENPFYVDTVRNFRDVRNGHKRSVKQWIGKFNEAKEQGDSEAMKLAKDRMALYESLQLAHKIILNSFYGYVMRRGARWYSMEMAAIVTHTGGNIIMDSRSLFDKIGMPLELDTDGIWTLLPKGFPEEYKFKFKDGKSNVLSFPCTMCNRLIYDKYANNQYQTLKDKKTGAYDTRQEMTVFFEIDGPYKCMLIPASKEEGKMLKKRYAVFNHAGKMTEVKGFELKRRGELQIVKIFQSEVFEKFLEGNSLQECYDSCGEVADRWYDILETKGEYVEDVELIDYIGESRVISKTLAEYGQQKGTALTAAKRLQEMLGPEIAKDKGLNVKFIISKKPVEAKVAARAIPTIIFGPGVEESEKKRMIRKWTGDNSLEDFDLRTLLDWDYYKERLGSTIQKIITIPAALQRCLNPVPRIEYPDWLRRRVKANNDKFKQKGIKNFFKTADIEEIGSRQVPSLGGSRAQANQKLNLSAEQKQSAASSQATFKAADCPLPDQDFKGWLKHQKSNWRGIRSKLKSDKPLIARNKAGIPGIAGPGGVQSAALENFMRNMDSTVLNSNWHILQIDQTAEPGIMRTWVMNELGNMFSVKLNVPRTIYINSKISNNQPDFKQVVKHLPRKRKVHQLFEWTCTEEHFQSKFNNIKYNHLMSKNIEGIYETKLPLQFRALMDLGCIVKPRKHVIPKNEQALGRVYQLKELENKVPGPTETQYLPANIYQSIYLLHSNQGQRHFWGLFLQANQEVQFFVVDPVKQNRNAQNQQALGSTLKNQFASTLTELENHIDFAGWQVTNTHVVGDMQAAMKLVDQKLQEYRSKNKGATLAVLQSNFTADRLQFMSLPTLHEHFPTVQCGVVERDNEFPALDWIRFACRNMTERFTEMGAWLEERINHSRYSFIPVGNLPGDAPLFIIDTLLARSLQLKKQLVWYSDTSEPDLGGHEDRNFRSYFQEEVENPQMNNKGFYRNYSIEIDVETLASNTILQSANLLKEYEDIDKINNVSKNKREIQAESKGDFGADLDEFATCQSAFQTLKDLVANWAKDTFAEDIYADELVSHLYRWVCSSTQAKLYDPQLHRMIHKLMKKCFMQLLMHFKQLGCQIVHASFHKIIVTTDKVKIEEANSHINFVIRTIQQKEQFRFITLQPTEFYKVLLYKDLFNWGGIRESSPDIVSAKWDMSNHLPEAVQKKFKMHLADYLLKVHRFNSKRLEQGIEENKDFDLSEDKIHNLMDEADDHKKQPDHEFICNIISNYFGSKLLTTVEEIYRHRVLTGNANAKWSDEEESDKPDNGSEYDQDEQDEDGEWARQQRNHERERQLKEKQKWEFPERISSYNKYSIPALEFTKFICQMFAIDPAFEHESSSLRRNLLTICHIKEFSPEVKVGNEPSLVLVIPDVICQSCQNARDLDICRDPSLNPKSIGEDLGEPSEEAWQCTNCSTLLDKNLIERRLLELLNRRVVTYQMQDVKCQRCKMVNNNIVSDRCTCTGLFEQTQGHQAPEHLKNQNLLNSLTDIRLFVKLIRNFATFHRMFVLKDTAQNLLMLFGASQVY